MTTGLMVAAITLIVISYFRVYQIKHITIAYEDPFGKMRGYAFDYAYPLKENWLNISEFERLVAQKKNMPQIRILQMQVETEWKLRRL